MRCDEPGREPDIASHDIKENCSLFGGEFSEEKVSISRRKRIFSDPVKCQNYMFDTDKVYTFESYDDVFSAPDYVLDLGFTTLGLKSILDGQPIQRLGKHRDGRYLWVSVYILYFVAIEPISNRIFTSTSIVIPNLA